RQRDLVSPRRALDELVGEEREAGTQTPFVLLPDAADDFRRELVAQQRAAVEGIPDGRLDLGQLFRSDRWMHDTVRVGPRNELPRFGGDRAASRKPERELV